MREYASPDRTIPAIVEDKARTRPDHVVLRFRDLPVTFAELHERSCRFANGLRALGVGAGDKIALMLPNCREFLEIWFGANRIGAICVPINVALRGDGLVHQLDHADCATLVCEADFLPQVEVISDRLPKLQRLVLRGGSQPVDLPGVEGLQVDELAAHSAATPALATSFRDVATIAFTSGTTGPSKGVMMTHAYWYEIWAAAVGYARYTEDDILYTGLPFFHTSAHGTTGPAMLADASAVIVERFSASRMLDDCRRWNCSSAKYIGGMLPILLKQPEDARDRNNPLRLLVGAAAPQPVFEAFERRFNTRLLELYGMTEASGCLVNPFDARRPGACGLPTPGWRVRIVDSDDNALPAGEVGEIVAQPERPFLGTAGYYRMPAESLDLVRNFWIHTGDFGRTDADGYFYYVDRKKHALRRRGENISSFEVETAINAHPAVLESCVVGVPSEVGEEEVKAVIVLRADTTLTAEEIVRWCEPRIAYFAVPRYIAFRASLPKTPSDRVEKYRLKAEGLTPDCWDREAAGLSLRRLGSVTEPTG